MSKLLIFREIEQGNLPEGNRAAALDVLAANPRAELSIERRLPAYREVMAEIRRTQAEVNRRTGQARQIVMRHNAERQRIENARREAVSRQVSEHPHLNFEPIQSQRTEISGQ